MGNRGGRDPGARSGDGGIEANQERRARMREMMLERATEQFHAMDSDGDEVLTTEEFLEATFARMDRDADGVLSAAELQPPERRGPRRGGPGRPRGERGGQSPQA